jgi:hypothetical protein
MCFIMAPWPQYTTNWNANVESYAVAQSPAIGETSNRNANVGTYAVAQSPAIGEALNLSLSPPSASGATPVFGQVWALSRDGKGCRDVQDAMDWVQSDEDCVAIVDELRGHVWEALCCPHANHVLQKGIIKMRPQNSQFIIDELLQTGRVRYAARHKYGCRVLQRILEHCRADQVQPIVDDLLADAVMLSKHAYASYVMAHIFEQGVDEQQHALMEVLVANAVNLAADGWACAVIEKAFMFGDVESCLMLASAILQENGLIARMALRRRGHPVVKIILDLFEEGSPEWASVRTQLRDEEASLRTARFGRIVLGHFSSGDDK